jgi:V/A-type H+-transporting ATPase subunit I
MFKPAKIFRTIAIIPKDSIQSTLSSLQKQSICQIKQAENDLEEIKPVEDEQKILNLYSRLEFVKETLEHYSNRKPKNPLKEWFSRKRNIHAAEVHLEKDKLFSKTEETLNLVENSVKEKISKIKDIENKRDENEYLISNLAYLPKIHTSILKNTPNQKILHGLISNTNLEKIKNIDAVLITKIIDKKLSLLIVITHPDNFQQTESVLHEVGFDRVKVPYEDNYPKDIIKRLKHENLTLLKEENSVLKELHKLYISYHSLLNYFHDELRVLKEKIDALSKIRSSSSFAILEAWVPENNMKKYNETISYAQYHEREDAPTLLDNPKIIKPFESLTELYSLPKYKAIDPTPILAITFSFFFGFMLTDAVYGFVLLALGLLLIRGKGSYDENTKNIGIILSTFGGFTLLLGMVFGSYFGDFFQQLGFNVPLLIDSMKQIMLVLIIALAIGVIHLITGLVTGIIDNKKKPLEAIHKQGVWILFIASLIAFILQFNIAGYILLALSVLLQIILTAVASGGITALLSIFSFPSFVGDLFSYGRLMALAIGTTGIALAVNFMTLMAWDLPYIGPIAAVLIFIIGHVFNMAMNGLGAFVHSIRLHFLEFFSKFYEGSGEKYIPFGATK